MAISRYKAQLNYYDPTYGWGNEGTASQGNWTGAGGNRTGVMYFPGLSALKGKIINSVKLQVTTGTTGYNASKTAKFYASANQGGIKTSLGASHKTGSTIGSVTGTMYNNSSTYTITFLSSRIAAGEDTFCIYDAGTTNYLKWSAVILEIDWSEPATQPTLNKTSVVMQEGTVTISTPASNSTYRHTLRYVFGSAKGTIATDVASSYAWTPPVSLAKQIPSAISGSGTIYCDTYSGSNLLGTKSVAITLTVPSSVVPSAGTLTASVTEDTSGTGLYVQGMGKARVRLNGAEGAQGSTIKLTKISGGGWSESDADMTTGILTTAGTIKFTATVTDSRGRTATATCSITVEGYFEPKIKSCSVYRCDASGNKKSTGTYAAIDIAVRYSENIDNALTLTVAYKLATGSSYGSSIALTNNGKTIINGSFATSSTYDVLITVADKYSSFTKTYQLRTKVVDISILKGIGVAFGKIAEIAGLDVGFAARFRNTVTFDVLPVQLAPSGYGLGQNNIVHSDSLDDGSDPANISASDDISRPGWYTVDDVDLGNVLLSGVLFPVRADSTDVQTAHWIDADMLYVLRRCRNSSGIWQPWEWENPPMLPDVEYRTTERHNGKPVYRKRITYTNTETIGNASGVTTINIPHGISDFGALVRCDTKIGTYTLPYIASGGGITTLCGVSTASIILRTLDTTWSSREWLFDLAYTK